MFEDVLKETGNNDEVMDVFKRINKEIVRFLRYDMRCSHVLLGRKEMKAIRENPGEDYSAAMSEEGARSIIVQIVEVDEDSYFAGAYIPDEGELRAKRLDEMKKKGMIKNSN
jgi:hypothetical protein